MSIVSFTGVLTDVNGLMTYFMPGLAVGQFFSGTLTVDANTPTPNIQTANLQIVAGAQVVNARSVAADAIKSFADHTPTGPLSSPTVQHGAIVDNVFFKVAYGIDALGTAGFTVQGRGPDGTTKAGAANGTLLSLTLAPKR